MSELPGPDQFAGPLPAAESAPGKDGLDSFDPVALFLDPQLAGFGARTLLGEANRLLYLGDAPGRLYRLHSLLPIDEVGLIAAPDLAHRQWGPPEPLPEEYEPPPPPPAPPDWSRFQDCQPPAPPEPLSPPLPEHAPCPTPFGFASPPASEPAPGEGSDARRWLTALPVLEPVAAYAVGPLLQVQRALIDLCAARADALAVLSLPGHFARRETLEWATALATTPEYATGSPPSYAAVYHPWLLEREEATPELAPLRAVPPDGAACGLIAARELSRGPWIAPANVPLRGVVGLAPALTASDEAALFDARVNLLGRQPGRFTPLSAHTLSQDHLLLQISVRRLLIFLRKLALRRGMRYVFESNNERFRQRVQGSFEQTLRLLTARGALAAFEVVTDDGLNTPNDRDNGRFLIALKVAPTMPIEFITVVLLRAGEGLLDVLER